MPPRRKATLSFDDDDDDQPRTALNQRLNKMEEDAKREAAETLLHYSQHDFIFQPEPPEPIPIASSWEQYQAMLRGEKPDIDLDAMEEDAKRDD